MKKLLSLFLVLVITLSAVACSKGKADNINDLAGDYELYAMTENGKKYDSEELQSLTALGLEISFKIDKKSNAELNLMGTKTKFKVDVNKHTLSRGGKSLKYTFKNGIMKWSNNKTVLKFKKKK